MILFVCARLYTCIDNVRLVEVSIPLPNSSSWLVCISQYTDGMVCRGTKVETREPICYT